ncbi:endoglucanase, partial [Streptomyces sp. MBT57]|nr:endoglucanase [Streptomyces sp. MBT57]
MAVIGSARRRPAEGSSERTNDGAGKGVRGVSGIHGQRRTTYRARRRGARRHGLLAVASAVVAIGATAGLIEAGEDGRRTTAVPEPTPPPVLQPLPAVPT